EGYGNIRHDRRGRARRVSRDDLAAAARIRKDRGGPDVVRRQEQVEVKYFLAVDTFDEADLDRLHRVRRIDDGQQRVVRIDEVVSAHRVVRIEQNLAQAVRVDVDRLCGARHAQRAYTCQRRVQRFSLERVHGF